MQKRLIILGNGFDLACGLSSRVSDFISYELKRENETNLNFIIFLVNTIYKKYPHFVGPNWCDFESLLRHYCFVNKSYNSAKIISYAKINGFKRKKSAEKLIDEELYENYFKARIIEYEFVSFDQFFHFELHKFEEKFCSYLQRNEHFLTHYFESKHRLLDLISADSQSGCILTFNYTKPFTNEYKYFKAINVHGEYIKKNIIMGVDITNIEKSYPDIDKYNYANIGDKRFLLKTFRKMVNDIDYPDLPRVLDDEIKIISVYGHSLSEQDYSYFQSIFDYYHIYDSETVLEFCYTEHEGNSKELDLVSGRVFKLINEYGETLSNKNHGKNLLHKLLLENRLRIREIENGFNKTIEIKGFRD